MFIERPPRWFRWLFPGAIFRIPSGKGERKSVYLTFDDGPIPEVTPWVLDLLDHYGIRATFFMVGQNVERNPELLEEVKKRGHSVGNHTLHHLQGASATTMRYMRDSAEGARLTGSTLFRPPHGWLRPRQLWALKKHYTVVMYDLVTRDYSKRLTSPEVVSIVKRFTRDGSIIVFHDSLKSLPRLREALPESIEWLLSEGYCFKTISPLNP
ncbi:MAG: polysaccharide deacetylase family protein [Muribaculaceae bacterium]|nr:polysaccharide deacetylase family protein [Muribaculaceae bacterium]